MSKMDMPISRIGFRAELVGVGGWRFEPFRIRAVTSKSMERRMGSKSSGSGIEETALASRLRHFWRNLSQDSS